MPSPSRVKEASKSVVGKLFVFLLARPKTQRISRALLQSAIRGLGYETCCSPKNTGEERFIEFLAATNPVLCVDVGANSGAYSSALLAATNSRVLGFESLPEMHRNLMALEEEFGERFTSLNWALGAESGTATIWSHPEFLEGASLLPESDQITYLPSDGLEPREIEVKTLDDSLNHQLESNSQEIDLLKIDVEGFELEVLKGGTETLAKRRPRFNQLEHNWHHLFKGDNIEKINDLLPDYWLYQILPYGSGLVKRDASRPESNLFFYSNFVFIRSDVADSLGL